MDTFTITDSGVIRKCLYIRSGWTDALSGGIQKLQILRQLMYYVRPADNARQLLRPCEIFDFIIGEGAGGILALFLGRFQMSIDDCQKHYINLMLLCFTETSHKPVNCSVKVPVGIDLSKIYKPFVAPGGGRHRPVQRARADQLSETNAHLKLSEKYCRVEPYSEKARPGGEFNITGSKHHQPGTVYLQSTTSPATGAYLIRWVRMTDALNLLINTSSLCKCSTVLFPANDYSENLLQPGDFSTAGCTQDNVDTLRRLLDALHEGSAQVVAAHPDTWSTSQGHPVVEDMDLLNVLHQACADRLSQSTTDDLSHILQFFRGRHSKLQHYEHNKTVIKIGRMLVPWTEFGHIQTYEPARDVNFARSSLRGFPAYKANRSCHDEVVELPSWTLHLRSDDILKTMFRKIALMLRETQAVEPVIQEVQLKTINTITDKKLSTLITTTEIVESPVSNERPLRLLSLDGGGVRGLSSVLILQEQMRLLEKEYGKKEPWEIFDIIAGTSTGGLLAIMLGRLRMSVDECIAEYEKLGTEIFGQPNGSTALYKYSGDSYCRIIKDLIKRKGGSEDLFMDYAAPDGKDCKVFVVCLDIATIDTPDGVKLIRTYTRDGSPDPGTYIWEAARATSAAPTIFPPITLESTTGLGSYVTLVDGGLGHNNPTLHLLREARAQFPGRKIGTVLSIGTGQQRGEETFLEGLLATTGGRIQAIALGVKYLNQTSTSSENINRSVIDWFDIKDYAEGLYRYTVPYSIGMNVKLDEFRKYDEIRTCTEEYLRQSILQEEMNRYVRAFNSTDGVMFALPKREAGRPAPLHTSFSSQAVNILQPREKSDPTPSPPLLTSFRSGRGVEMVRPKTMATQACAVAAQSPILSSSPPLPLRAETEDVKGLRNKFRFKFRGRSTVKAA